MRPEKIGHGGNAPIDTAYEAAERGMRAAHDFLSESRNKDVVETALRIRAVENALYALFGKGKLHGTIHTCIGQEFSGALLGRYLQPNDFVTSNHRCHGHFIGATKNWRALIDELVGNEDGICAGIGSSQHLWAKNFMSNGQQGGMLPVAAGIALDRKTRGTENCVVSFLGEGTLGEGIVYETLNIDALWNLPHVLICENNYYSQSTSQSNNVAGAILDRAAAFSVTVAKADNWHLTEFDVVLADAIERARTTSRPSFILLSTYRLNPHSKGDDSRDSAEIEWFRAHDPATLAVRDFGAFADTYNQYIAEAEEHITLALEKPQLAPAAYFSDQLPRATAPSMLSWRPVDTADRKEQRVGQALNEYYAAFLARDDEAFFLGEDIADPYGGAFKISKGFTTAFPERVISTPISEAAITGAAIGLAVSGRRAFVEIMFGDFITYAFDQIINNASKFFHMYNRQVECPVIVRTPMGGRRGYGPTHSQSLERFLIGVDNCCTISLNSIVEPQLQLTALESMRCPVILVENKIDYANRFFVPQEGFLVEMDNAALPTLRVRPQGAGPTVTLLAYGGIARFTADRLVEIFERGDHVPELIVPTSLSPLNLAPIAQSVAATKRLLVIEEGPRFASAGAEIIAQLIEEIGCGFAAARIGGKQVPIPSAPALESAALPSVEDICAALQALGPVAF